MFVENLREYSPNDPVLVNTTPHEIVLRTFGPDGDAITIPSLCDHHHRPVLTEPVRVSVETIPYGEFRTSYGFDETFALVEREVFGDVVGLPDPTPGIVFIVSRVVAAACPDRDDLLVPGQLIRDDDGRIVGCGSLIKP